MTAGRFSRATADRLLAEIEDGASLRAACEAVALPRRTIRSWIERRPAFAAAFRAASALRLETVADEIIDLAAQAQAIAAGAEDKKANAMVNALRVEIDSKKWLLSKLMPERFGDRLTMNSDDPIGDLTLEQRLKLDSALQSLAEPDRKPPSSQPRADRARSAGAAQSDQLGPPQGDRACGSVAPSGRSGRQPSDPFTEGPRRRRGPKLIGLGPAPDDVVH